MTYDPHDWRPAEHDDWRRQFSPRACLAVARLMSRLEQRVLRWVEKRVDDAIHWAYRERLRWIDAAESD